MHHLAIVYSIENNALEEYEEGANNVSPEDVLDISFESAKFSNCSALKGGAIAVLPMLPRFTEPQPNKLLTLSLANSTFLECQAFTSDFAYPFSTNSEANESNDLGEGGAILFFQFLPNCNIKFYFPDTRQRF